MAWRTGYQQRARGSFRGVSCLFGLLLTAGLVCSATVTAEATDDDYKLAVGLYKQERWELAAETFQKFIESHPDDPQTPKARLYRGFSLMNLDKYAEARQALRTFVDEHPQNEYLADAMFRVGECSYELDDHRAAEKELQAYLAKFPEDELREWALPYLGDVQLRLNKPQAAAASFREALDAFPDGQRAADATFGLADANRRLGQTAKALELYKELASGKTDRAAEAQLQIGTVHFDAGRYAEAASAYAQLEKRFPESGLVPLARLNAGYAHYQRGDYEQAIRQFERAAQDDARKRQANYWTGISYKALGDYERAARILQQVLEAKPDDAIAQRALFHSADCELNRGRNEEAKQRFLQVVDRWPQGGLADDGLYFAAEAALLQNELDEAEKLAARFAQDYPDSSLREHLELLRGRILYARGESHYQQAASRFRQVLEDTDTPRIRSLARFHLARVLQQMDEHAEAVEAIAPLAEQVQQQGASSEFAEALVLYSQSRLELDKYREAGESASRYLELAPQGGRVDQALAVRAVARAAQGDKTAAQADLDRLRENHPRSPHVARTIHRIAEIAYDNEDWQWAAQLFAVLANAGGDSPYHAAGLSGLAWCRYESGRFDEAAKQFGRVLDEHPDDPEVAPEAAYMRGKALQDAGKLEEAARAYAEAFKTYAPEKPAAPGNEDKGAFYYAYRAGLQAARTLRRRQNIDEADAAYEKLVKRFPQPKNLDKLLDEWALLNYEAGRYGRADELFRRLIEERPESGLADNARLSLAESDLVAGKLDEARREFQELQASEQSDEQVRQVALHHLIEIAVTKGDWNTVASLAEQLQKRFPEGKHVPMARYRRAEALLHREQFEEAQTALARLRETDSEQKFAQADWYPRVWVLTAEIHLRQKDYDKVTRTVEELRSQFPESRFLYQADEILGRAYKNQAQFEEARTAFRRVVDSEHGKKTETAAKSQFLLAETYLIQKKHQQALVEYLKVYNLYKYPEWQAPALLQAGRCDEALGHWKEAAGAYEDLLEEFPDSEFADKAKKRLSAVRKKAG